VDQVIRGYAVNKGKLHFYLMSFVTCLVAFIAAGGQVLRVDSPSGVNGPTVDLASLRKSAVVVSIPTADQFYLGSDRTPEDQLGRKIGDLLKRDGIENQIVYIAAGSIVNYGSVTRVMHIIRDQGVGVIALLGQRGTDNGVMSYLLIEIPMPAKANDDVSKLKPNPLTLVASISFDLQLKLNGDSGPEPHELCFDLLPNGLGGDPGRLEKWLDCLFRSRTKQRAYKIGMETRSDIPDDQRIEKTVFIKASRSIRYGDVIRVIDAVKGAGANPIGLQIDDLPQ